MTATAARIESVDTAGLRRRARVEAPLERMSVEFRDRGAQDGRNRYSDAGRGRGDP